MAGLVVAALAMFGELADSVRENGTLVRLDDRVMTTVVDHRTAWLTRAARTVSLLGEAFVVAAVVCAAVVALVMRGHRRLAALLVVSSAGAAVLVAVSKAVVGRPRPPSSHQLVGSAGEAFPSGHAAQSVACYVALALVVAVLMHSPRGRVLVVAAGVVIAFTVGLSRVYLGVHWPSDVASGWLLGAGWLVAVTGVVYAIANRRRSAPPRARRVSPRRGAGHGSG